MTSWRQTHGLFYGWRMLALSIPLVMVLYGLTKRSFGLFFEPLQDEFGWSAAVIAFVFSLDRVEGGFLAPVTGYMNDRLGGRKLMLTGIAVIGLALVLASQIHSLWQFFAVFLLANLGASLASIMTMQAVMVRWFDRYLGRAIGILETAPALGALLVPILALAMTRFGWRAAFAISGIAITSICFPLALFIRSRPQDYGLEPDGAAAQGSAQHQRQVLDHGKGASRRVNDATVGQALHLPGFWFIAFSLGVFGLGQNAQRLLLIPHLQARGFSRELASITVAIGGIAIGTPAHLLVGWTADRVDVKRMFPLVFLVAALGLFVLANAGHVWHVLVFVLLYEVAFAANLIFQAKLIVQFFGTKRYASIRGLMHFVGNLVAIAGPVIGGAMFDITGSYQLFFIIISGVVLLGIPFIMLAKPVSWEEQGPAHQSDPMPH